ncbi:MAG TPA: glycosyltransferase, partial [Niastella sp.]
MIIKNSPAKISFCIVCMNRLHHLQQTFLRNIHDNDDYPNLEIVLLDYNSQDGMELWVNENLREFIAAGRVTYYKTFEPQVFSHSHSKNLAFRLASGDIVCNINADHFTGKGFGHYVNET